MGEQTSPCVDAFLQVPDRCLEDIFDDYMDIGYDWLSSLNAFNSKLVLFSNLDVFLRKDLSSSTPSEFVSCIRFLCRNTLPLINQGNFDFQLGTMTKCICQKCPLIVDDITPFKCGPKYRFDWLFSSLEDYSFSAAEVGKLFDMLKLNCENLQEERYLTQMVMNKDMCSHFDKPVTAFRYQLRLKTKSVLSSKNFKLKVNACGCGFCPIFKPLYWEAVFNQSHISSLPSLGREFLCFTTWSKCEEEFLTNHSWMLRVFSNVKLNDKMPLITQMPTYQAFVDLVAEMNMGSEDLALLAKGDTRKSYFNSKYGCRKMMVFILVVQKGLKIHVPWHVYNDKKVKRKADKIIAEIRNENEFLNVMKTNQEDTRDLIMCLREGEPVTQTLDANCLQEFYEAMFEKPMMHVAEILKHDIHPGNQKYYDLIMPVCEKTYRECITPAWKERPEKIKIFCKKFKPWEQFKDEMERGFAGEMDLVFKNQHLKTHNLSHSCEPEQGVGPRRNMKFCSVYPWKEMDEAFADFIENGVDITEEIKYKQEREQVKIYRINNEIEEQKPIKLAKFIHKAKHAKIVAKPIEKNNMLMPENLLDINQESLTSPDENKRLNHLLNQSIFALKRSLIKKVNDQMKEMNYPFFFDKGLRPRWLGYSIPIGRGSDRHLDAMYSEFEKLIKGKTLKELLCVAANEIAKDEGASHLLNNVASELKRRASITCKSRRLRLQICSLPSEKIIHVHQMLGQNSLKDIRNETNLTSGVIKRIIMMPNVRRISRYPE